MALYLFAGIPVSDYAAALAWYERLLGSPPLSFPNDTEAVWELAEHRYVYIEELPGCAGDALRLIQPCCRRRAIQGMHRCRVLIM